MSAELGHLALWLSLGFALALGVLPLAGAQRGRADWMALARPLAVLLAATVAVSYACLTASFVVGDFSVRYVATHSNSALPMAYKVAGVWGGHEGSLLLWILMLVGWTVAVAAFSRSLPPTFVARTLAVMGLVAVGFLLFTLLTSNPFVRLLPPPVEGRDLNPLLQDPGMVLHPPMLYMGYVGFSVAFAFAIAALIGGRLDATWARWTRPWTTSAWLFMTIGIALGSWWAYYELGWGGWWFWDPVENASFMPWLVGTALIHSLAVTEKRNAFKSWTVLLAIVAFSLSLLGTFLVRSGVLSSVHAFATDPTRGVFILGFLVVVIGGSLALYAWRAPALGLGQRFEPVSREAFLLGNNMFLAAAAGAVLLGTLYPLAIDALGLGKISVGPPYFDVVFGALMLPLLLLLGIGPLTHWKRDAWREIGKRLSGAMVFSVLAAAVTLWAYGLFSFWIVAGVLMAWWIVASVGLELRTWWKAGTLPRANAGMLLAHLGTAVFVFGVTGVRSLESERDVSLAAGRSAEIGGYRFSMSGLREVEGPNYLAMQGEVQVSRTAKPDEVIASLKPEKRAYPSSENPMTEAAIHSRPWGDLYVSMGEPLPDGSWLVRLHIKPFVTWIWGGAVLMALGGVLAASDRRYRVRRREAVPGALAAAAD